MKKSSFVILAFIGIIILLSIVQGAVSNKISTKGVMVGTIEEQVNYYKTDNAILSEKLLSYSSLRNILLKATDAGFEQKRKQIVLSSSVPLAVRP